MGFARCSGILMPLSSLPGGYGIGSMGAPARKFVDFLAAAGQTIWQILPVGPTGYADSPYQSCSAFAGNPYFIDLDQLVKDGLLTRRDFAKIHWGGDAAHIDYGTLYEKRFDVLRKAYANFLKQRPVPGYDTPYPDDWYRFQFLSCEWLPDYCLYMAIKRDNGMVDWQQWPEALRLRDPAALAAFKEEHAEEVGFWAFVQYEFDRQWRALHAYAKSKGVSIMGDIPIYVAADSADAWAGRELFETDADGKPRRVAGCPPDCFSETGQLWGNPLYDWKYHKKTGYEWWMQRIAYCYQLYDVLRIDHFRGFDEYWFVPYGDPTAQNGHWEKGPGYELFAVMKKKLGKKKVIAEDLGFLTPSVIRLVKKTGYPGMKILQFAFDAGNDSEYLPHNYDKNCVVYTGTHDNDTTVGFIQNMPEKDKKFAKKYLGHKNDKKLCFEIVRAALSSCADTAVIPMQDYLELDSSARINIPSTLGCNWKWRMDKEALDPKLAKKIYKMAKLYGRL